MFFFFKQKTAYEIKECDWSSDVCSSDLLSPPVKIDKVHSLLPQPRSDRSEFNVVFASFSYRAAHFTTSVAIYVLISYRLLFLVSLF